jgi:hypothetical protein
MTTYFTRESENASIILTLALTPFHTSLFFRFWRFSLPYEFPTSPKARRVGISTMRMQVHSGSPSIDGAAILQLRRSCAQGKALTAALANRPRRVPSLDRSSSATLILGKAIPMATPKTYFLSSDRDRSPWLALLVRTIAPRIIRLRSVLWHQTGSQHGTYRERAFLR